MLCKHRLCTPRLLSKIGTIYHLRHCIDCKASPGYGHCHLAKMVSLIQSFYISKNQGFNRSSFDYEHNCYCHKHKLITATLLLTCLSLSVKGAGITWSCTYINWRDVQRKNVDMSSLKAPWQMTRTKTNTQNSTKNTQNTKEQQTFRKKHFFVFFGFFYFYFFFKISSRNISMWGTLKSIKRVSYWVVFLVDDSLKRYTCRQIFKGLKQILQVTR